MDFFQILFAGSSGLYAEGIFLFCEKKIAIFCEYFSFSLTLNPMGAKILKATPTNQSRKKVIKLFLNFLPNGLHKTTFQMFEILKIEILTNF